MKKTIHFDKYVPYTLTKNIDGTTTEKKLNLHELFNILQSSPSKESLREFWGEKYRIQVCKYHADDEIWELQVLHLRNTILPGVADEESNYEPLILPEGNYPTESCTILYSPKENLIYQQRNIVCLSAKRFAHYLKTMLPETTKLLLKPVSAGERIERITKSAGYRKIVLACTLDPKKAPDKSKRLGRLLSDYGTYQGLVANITIGMGRKSGRLNSAEVAELVKEAYEESDVQALRVQLDSTGIGNFEWLDLMLDRDSYSIPFDYSKDDPLLHTQLFAACLSEIKKERIKE